MPICHAEGIPLAAESSGHVTRMAWLVPAERAISSDLDEIAASWTLPGRGEEWGVQRAVSPSATSDDGKPTEPPDVAAIGRQEAT